jgi:cyclophilin family peptidyl-prolyl cis-trans isomerase
MTTSKGVIYLELNAAKAPISTENFVSYTKEGFYNGTIFHRVIKTFMIQGGGFTADMKQKATKAPISNEWQNGLPNSRGAISMARTNEPNSATSQFFINTVDNKMLDQPRGGAAYAVFGKVIKGMDVVDAIAAVPTGPSSGMGDVPKTVVTIEKMEVLAGPPAMDAPAAPAAPAPTTPAAPTGTKTP